jgi:hypothetical protein
MGIVDDRDLYIAHLGDCAAVIGRCENEDHALTQVSILELRSKSIFDLLGLNTPLDRAISTLRNAQIGF